MTFYLSLNYRSIVFRGDTISCKTKKYIYEIVNSIISYIYLFIKAV